MQHEQQEQKQEHQPEIGGRYSKYVLAILVIVPAADATVYAPSHLNPGSVGLLFITEISVGAGTAALFANEPFGLKEITGIILTTLAGIAEPIRMFMGARTEGGPKQAPR